MRFGALGPLVVWDTTGQPTSVPERKVRALLARLLLADGAPVTADRLLDDVWSDQLPANPGAVLRSKLSQLRRILDEAEPDGRSRLTHQPAGYTLQLTGAGDRDATDTGTNEDLDAQRFQTLVNQAGHSHDPVLIDQALTQALDLWRGPFLADLADDDFIRSAALRWEERRLAAVEQRAEARLALGRPQALIDELAELLDSHPRREQLRGLLMQALYRAGRQGDALDLYEQHRLTLRDNHGLSPGTQLATLQVAILNHDLPPAPQPASQPATAAEPATPAVTVQQQPRLPTPLTPLVGREAELAHLQTQLRDQRLVTLTGPGGVGKTRTALEAATRMPSGHDTHLIELAGLDDHTHPHATRHPSEEDVARRIAEALGLSQDGDTLAQLRRSGHHLTGNLAVDHLAHALADRELLLVLDNCEHVIDPVAQLSERLLRQLPHLCILATSREPLQVTGEAIYDLPPLDLPPLDPPDLDTLRRSGAVQLFAARAREATFDFTLDAHTGPWVASICHQLDGLPLALELAASQVRTLGLDELSARLDDRLHMLRQLGPARRTAPSRHQTLETVIDWSWERLSPDEQTVLRRIAIHSSTWSLDAAVATSGLAESATLDALTRLVNKSLVFTSHSTTGRRYGLLEPIAAYGNERLNAADPDEAIDARRRFHDHYLTLTFRAAHALKGPGQVDALRQLDTENPNLRSVLDSLLEHDEALPALQLVNDLCLYWCMRDKLGDGREAVRRTLDRTFPHATTDPTADDPISQARLEASVWYAGFALWGDRDELTAVQRSEQAADQARHITAPGRRALAEWFLATSRTGLSLSGGTSVLVDRATEGFRAVDDRWGLALTTVERASQQVIEGRTTSALRDAEEAMAVFTDLDNPWGQVASLQLLHTLHDADEDYDRSHQRALECLELTERIDLPSEQSYTLSRLGQLALHADDRITADAYHERARQVGLDHGNDLTRMIAEVGLSISARWAGRLDDAERYLRRWIERERALNSETMVMLMSAELGYIAEQRSDPPTALAHHHESHRAAQATGNQAAIALSLAGLASALHLAGRPIDAARCLGSAAAQSDGRLPFTNHLRREANRVNEQVEAALGSARFKTEVDRGATIPTAQLTAALNGHDSTPPSTPDSAHRTPAVNPGAQP